MLAKAFSAGVLGIDGYLIEIEVDVANGLPQISIVGLPDTTVKEAKDRVRSAIKNSGFSFPVKRITINLAPADTKKEGSAYDLPIALGILAANEKISPDILRDNLILGELSLDGTVKAVNGIISMIIGLRELKRKIIVPADNAQEAAIVSNSAVYPVKSLSEAAAFLNGEIEIIPQKIQASNELKKYSFYEIDMADVKGQLFAKRALEVAVAGNHNIILVGPPGSGKTMLAKRIPTIIPELTFDEALETTKLYSISGLLPKKQALIGTRPFRSPHHTASNIALVGGGSNPKPGEVSLAHHGVLFLDELPEFNRSALESLRQPLEDGMVTVSRASRSITFPARVMLAAAMNPCPCGFFTHPTKACRCTPHKIEQYRSKISGPLLDRIDIHIEVPPVNYKDLTDEPSFVAGGDGERRETPGRETSHDIRKRVNKARSIQLKRFKKSKVFANAHMPHSQIKKHCALDEESKKLLKMAIDELGLSARAYDKILKVARTIADLAECENINSEHISEAIQYRSLDRNIIN
ncbi:MAG: YifB family Mg chelatase-like AAA ATPase [Candidatus Omnitrophica bacterium]|nr:YifB family Mg chelatase-like AAA ATPase [Candidatus Omnitrophota bacterium]MBU4478095.1 YifB family Mg chelatase-like AAA ATPase [Candidatus Omnitrophota bacterium]MCG2704405.1 YifB family Mg chelatase-like AAA ATPase [Candidatus Omnitrophota bacterium]